MEVKVAPFGDERVLMQYLMDTYNYSNYIYALQVALHCTADTCFKVQ